MLCSPENNFCVRKWHLDYGTGIWHGIIYNENLLIIKIFKPTAAIASVSYSLTCHVFIVLPGFVSQTDCARDNRFHGSEVDVLL